MCGSEEGVPTPNVKSNTILYLADADVDNVIQSVSPVPYKHTPENQFR